MLAFVDYSKANRSDCHINNKDCILIVKWPKGSFGSQPNGPWFHCPWSILVLVLFLSLFFFYVFFFKPILTIVLCFNNFIFHYFWKFEMVRECLIVILHSNKCLWLQKMQGKTFWSDFLVIKMQYRLWTMWSQCQPYLRVVYAALRLRNISCSKRVYWN